MSETNGTPPIRKRSLKGWLKRNKLVVGITSAAGILWFIRKGGGSGDPSIINAEGETTGANAIQLVPVSTPANEEASGAEEIYERNLELENERRERGREEAESEIGIGGGEGGGTVEPVEPPEAIPSEPPEAPLIDPAAHPAAGGVTIHGKHFANATGYRIAGTGKRGDKAYTEYAITFPGKVERWRYFGGSGNWEHVTDSSNGPGSGAGNGKGGNGGAGGGGTGGGAGTPPQNNPDHPDAVNTGNRCVNGGVGPHTAPPGYHLFCDKGWIWRAKDNIAVGPGKPVSKPKPAPAPAPKPNPAPAPPSCPSGTVQNIQQNRAEAQRLQGEIDQLTAAINAHPNAKERPGWISNRAGKQARRDQCIDAVNRGRQQPGCGNV